MNNTQNYNYSGHTTYKICVLGQLDSHLKDVFGGFKIENLKTRRNEITTLTGKLTDQSALSGLLNTLFNYNYTILSVVVIENPDEEMITEESKLPNQ